MCNGIGFGEPFVTSVIAHENGETSDIHSTIGECRDMATPTNLKIPLVAKEGRCKSPNFNEWHDICRKYFDYNYDRNVRQAIAFPPEYMYEETVCCELPSKFLECLRSDKRDQGLAVVGYDARKHLQMRGYGESHFESSQLKVPEDSKNRILLYYQRNSHRGTASVVINVRITEGLRLEDVQRAQNDCNEDLKAFGMLFGSYMKKHHMVLYGITAAPNISCEEELVAKFACQMCVEKRILRKEELSGDLKSWWKYIGQEIDEVASRSKYSEDDLFFDVSSEIMAVMSARSNILARLYGSDHEKIITLFLNNSQLKAIKSMEKKENHSRRLWNWEVSCG